MDSQDRSPAPLICHPARPPGAISAVRAACWRAGGTHLAFRFEFEGDMDRLLLPDAGNAARRDGLWEHTCCEAFVASRSGGYAEFNFAPDGSWAAYRFASYRDREQPDPVLPPPVITTQRKPEIFILEAMLSSVAVVGSGAGVRIGLAVVAEETDGRRSYWALAHEKEQPDFHQPGSFLGTLISDTEHSPGKEHAS